MTEANWREGGNKDKNFLESESPLFVGRAIAALAADPRRLGLTGQLLSSWELARKYKVTDYDGRRPDWGRLEIDVSMFPALWIDLFRTGTDLEITWLSTLLARSKKFRSRLPQPRPTKVGGPMNILLSMPQVLLALAFPAHGVLRQLSG